MSALSGKLNYLGMGCAPAKSTFNDALNRRSEKVFEAIYFALLSYFSPLAKLQRQVIDSKNPIEESKSVSDQIAKLAAAIEKLDKKTNIIQIQEGFILFSRWLQEHPVLQSTEGFEFIKEIDKYQGEYLNYRFQNQH